MSGAQILVVEDEGVVARSIQTDLQSMGYAVGEVASSGEEAVEQAEETHPDLVLMDVVLKGNMDGIEAAEEIRRRFDIPVVYLTAYEDAETMSRAKLTEPFGYLLKPFEDRELRAAIEVALYKHRIEAQLRATERWLATTLQSIAEGMIATDAQLRIRLLNPVAERLIGCAAEDAFGKELAEVCTLVRGDEPIDLRSLGAEAIRAAMGVALPDDVLLVAGAGRGTPVEGSLAPILDDGHLCGHVLILRDISERRAMEQARRQGEEQLRHAQKMEAVSRLAGGVAHDFNNLLTVMLGNTSLVRSRLPQDDANVDLLADVESAAERAAQRVEQLVAVSGHTRLRLGLLNLNALIRESLGHFGQSLGPGVTIEFHLTDDLWDIQADRPQMVEVISNLCQNAQDAMPDGGQLHLETENVVLGADRAALRPDARLGDYVCLRARDTGRGIPATIRQRIYDPYFSTKDFPSGRGLGLALVYGIVEQHHGWIECASAPGQGTSFDIYLPRYLSTPPSVATPSAPLHRQNRTTTILLAEGEPMLRELGRKLLEEQGYQVLLAEDGVESVRLFQQERYQIDLVILDRAMSRLSGDDACRHLLEIDPGVCILLSGAYAADDPLPQHDRILGLIRKPYRQKELTGTVAAALEQVNVSRRDLLLMLVKRLEQSLSASLGRESMERVALLLERVEQMLRRHIAEIGAADGPFTEVDQTKPSTRRDIDRVRGQYASFLEQADTLKHAAEELAARFDPTGKRWDATDSITLRHRLHAFVAALEANRQEEINLVLQSTTTDIEGGEG